MTILVTGCAGFIGFHTTMRLLKLGYSVVGIDNLSEPNAELKKFRLAKIQSSKFVFHKIDINNFNHLSSVIRPLLTVHPSTSLRVNRPPTAIIHLAAETGVRRSFKEPEKYINTNIHGWINILELARINKIKTVVFASSSSAYGDAKMPKNGFSENQKLGKPLSLYGETKQIDEELACLYHKLYSIHITGLRFFTVYGPWGRPDMVYFSFAHSIVDNKPISVFNNGNMFRDFTYIDDIVSGIVKAVEKSYTFEIINLGNHRPIQITKLIKYLEDKLYKKAVIQFEPMQKGDLVSTSADISKAHQLLGFQPRTKLEKGIEQFIKWYQRYFK